MVKELYAAIRFVVALLLVSLIANSVIAQNEKAESEPEEPKPKVEMLECRVKVVDPDGHPIEEATIFCSGLRSKEERSSHWGWSVKNWGEIPRIKTDAAGMATMTYPKMITDEQTTGFMTWSVQHPDFVNYREDHSVEDDPAEISLERGFRIALTAKRSSEGEKLKDNLMAIASFPEGGDWEQKKNGMLVSSTMKQKEGILRVAYFEEGKPTLFSDEIEVDPGDKSRVLLKDIELSKGWKLKGKLDDAVPRPIKNGIVIASICKKPNPNDWSSRWNWTDETKINEDGTFTFESLPAGESIQLIPVCDDWVPAKPKPEDVIANLTTDDPTRIKGSIDAFTVTPHVIRLSKDETEITLPMVKASTVTLTVVDKDGKPLSKIPAGTNPNQFWFNSGSQIYGNSYPTRKLWELKKSGVDLMTHYRSIKSPYYKETDENGRIVFKNVPRGSLSFGAYSDDLEMAKNAVSGRRGVPLMVTKEEISLTIKLYPKGEAPAPIDLSVGKKLQNWLGGMFGASEEMKK